ncbi:RimK family alpha-L-glutamate ligase [Sulfolobus acidocaldarius DSM 639]|nr:RimK family alpha-L-glutamate ligase [Sulfolobus acidocaldarius]WCM34896.1 RimK family alpha-L-glutamate ligase [Sulfolobus acidocaldarius DSM 639]
MITKDGVEYGYAGNTLEIDGGLIRNLGFISSTEQLIRRYDTLRSMEKSGITLINRPDAMFVARDKFYSLVKLKNAGIPVPETAVVEDPFEAMRLVMKWKDVVIKPVVGSLGLGSIRAEDPDIVFRVSKSLLSINQPIYIQKYINKPQRDIRIFAVGDRILGGIYRINKSSWKTNVAQGSLTQVITVNQDLEEITLKSMKVLGLDYAGIDIVEDESGDYKILEVNGSPLWGGFYEATKINPAKYIVEHLIKKMKK